MSPFHGAAVLRTLPSFTSARAVLVGTGTYVPGRLAPIPHSLRNIHGLADVLTDGVRGGFARHHVALVPDPDRPEEIMRPVQEAAEQAQEALLVYYSGHGLLENDSQDLHLSLTTSEPGKAWTSLPFGYLAEALKESRATVKIVILDCCFSGRAHAGLMGDESRLIMDQLAHRGLYCLTSAPETKRSLAPAGETYSAFTGCLLTTMENGVADAGPVLRMGDLWAEVYRRMRATRYPLPEQSSKKNAADFPLVANKAYVPPPPPPPTPVEATPASRPAPTPRPRATTPTGRLAFDTVSGGGYDIEKVHAEIDGILAGVSHPDHWRRVRPPYFPRVSGKGRHGFDSQQVDAYVEQHRREPTTFVDALRVVLIRQDMALVSDGEAGGRKIAKLGRKCGLAADERLIGYVKSSWYDSHSTEFACSDRCLCLADLARGLVRVPYAELPAVGVSSATRTETWSGSTDQGGFGGESTIVTTTVRYGGGRVEFREGLGTPLLHALQGVRRGMADLALRHPEWFGGPGPSGPHVPVSR
ncbi:caspase family protein [Streptomyces sp. NPDC093225]|uniref:caspase, EACC1-associated type n=1 Tax=Streptomyces sp. NPDC093225 TaxID=3366034 RepID=UPI00380EFBE7